MNENSKSSYNIFTVAILNTMLLECMASYSWVIKVHFTDFKTILSPDEVASMKEFLLSLTRLGYNTNFPLVLLFYGTFVVTLVAVIGSYRNGTSARYNLYFYVSVAFVQFIMATGRSVENWNHFPSEVLWELVTSAIPATILMLIVSGIIVIKKSRNFKNDNSSPDFSKI